MKQPFHMMLVISALLISFSTPAAAKGTFAEPFLFYSFDNDATFTASIAASNGARICTSYPRNGCWDHILGKYKTILVQRQGENYGMITICSLDASKMGDKVFIRLGPDLKCSISFKRD